MTKTAGTIPPALWRNPACLLAFGFGAGALPKAPGTWGTLLAVPFYFLLQPMPWLLYAGLLVALFALGVWCSTIAARRLGVHDHPAIVWDEMVGYWTTMIAAPAGWIWVLIGFMLFRLFDIWKPWPIRATERRISGGLGIMIDDVIAGVFAGLIMFAAAQVIA